MSKVEMTLYDYAKQVAAAEEPMDTIAANIKYNEMAKFIASNKYTMFLCREKYDYTVFNKVLMISNIAKELRELVEMRGDILIVDKQPDGAYEIWIRDHNTKENSAYYLFNAEGYVLEV